MSVFMPSFRLDGRRALVTGASRGIGLAIAGGLSAMGAEVTLCGRTKSTLAVAAKRMIDAGFKAHIMVADVTDITYFTQAIAKEPSFDILVNNVGGNRPKSLVDTSVEDFDTIMNLNIRSVFFATQAVTKKLLEEKKHGSVINISSQMGHVGARHRTVYCASKWAMEGFTKALGVELAPHGIRVNSICPTFIETELTKPFWEDKNFYEEVIGKIPLGHLGHVNDVVGAAIFLASEASGLMTGSALMVDGGWTAQ